MTRASRLAATSLLALVVTTLGVVGISAPATAAEPVVADDAVKGYAGAFIEVKPLANDADPDGDELAVCRVGEPPNKKLNVIHVEDSVLVVSSPKIKPGTYEITYYACDFETLVPGTITVTILESPKITAKALPGRPGMVKVTNPANFRMVFMYGSFRNENPDGTVKIPRHSSVTFRVRRTKIDWIAFSPRNGFSATGHIRDIKLPPGTTPPDVEKPVSGRSAELWRS